VRRFHPASATPELLVHYTSTSALISIVANNELWLSDATFLNDRAEIDHGRNLARDRIALAMAAEKRSDVLSMLELASSRFEKSAGPHIYVACFSLEVDDLTQWRGYGSSGAPVAVEFAVDPLMFGYVSEGIWQHVLYDPADQMWVIDQVLSAYTEAYAEDLSCPRTIPRKEPLTREEERELCAKSLYYALWRYIVAFKDPAFRAEREVRFAYTAHDLSQWGQGWHPQHPKPLFRESYGRVIPYLSSRNLDFTNMARIGSVPKLPIRSVRIGPMDDQGLIARGVRRLLDTFDHLGVGVVLSNSPLRPR
jgi:hypothetical protein